VRGGWDKISVRFKYHKFGLYKGPILVLTLDLLINLSFFRFTYLISLLHISYFINTNWNRYQ